MKAEDLKLNELIEFGDGEVKFQGRRLVLHSLHAFAQFRKDLLDMVGLENARRILTRFGYFWGQADAAAMQRTFKWDSLREWLLAGARLHSMQGVARNVVTSLDIGTEGRPFRMAIVWHDSGEAEEHLAELGATDHAVCWMLTGYASGYASYCVGRNVYFIEEACRAKGDPVCSATGAEQASWGGHLAPYLEYFRAEDIKGKIAGLTERLRRQSESFARERMTLKRISAHPRRLFFEVRSPAFQKVLDIAERVAQFDTSVLITGETGVGKEVLARHIHRSSPRSGGPFVAIGCGALPETLLESELFGHKAGAFTGAVEDRIGLFEQAAGGTVLLDEIGDIVPAVQLKILRVLQEREIFRLGESKPRKIDVRMVAATNRDLERMIREQRFREDLYYRLRIVEIRIPALRERPEDILPLARYFVEQFAKKLKRPGLHLVPKSLEYIQAYSWPGNVRELENAIERAAVMTTDVAIGPESLPSQVTRTEAGLMSDPLRTSLAEAEIKHIMSVLEATGGNRTRAAGILGISPSTLWRKLSGGSRSAMRDRQL